MKNKVDTAILSENIDEINFKNIKIYNCSNYLKEVSKSTFEGIINIVKIPINKLSVCVVDRDCEHPDFIYSLANKCSIIKIITNNFEKYLPFAEKIYNDFGMQPIVTSFVDDADLGIDLNSEIPKIWFNNQRNYVHITKKCVKIGIGFRKFVPTGINQCDFAGFLQNYNEFKRLKLVNADMFLRLEKLYKINAENIQNFLDNK